MDYSSKSLSCCSRSRTLTAIAIAIATSTLPAAAQDAPDAAHQPSVSLGGLIQGRYAYEYHPGEHRDQFSLRRAWLDARADIAPGTDARLQLDTSNGDVGVRDAWLNYQLNDTVSTRLGQQVVPFGLPRSIGSPNRLFTELSLAGNHFEVPQGRDVGLSAAATGRNNSWRIRGGVFDGRGRIDRRDDSRPDNPGRLVSLRGSYALVGDLPGHAGTESRPVEPTLTLGAGAKTANRNHLRDWSLGLVDDIECCRANWQATTVDFIAGYGLTALSGAAFKRWTSPAEFSRYQDRGLEVQLAQALPGTSLEAVARHSFLHRDINNDLDEAPEAGRDKEWSAGVNLYHEGNRRKTQFIASSRDSDEAHWEAQLQHQVRF